MKRMMKKGLSLALAVIMLMSTLPMNAMAAMIMDDPDSGRVEVPVTDKVDRGGSTHAGPVSGDSDDRPEVPDPGGEGEGDLNAAEFSGVTSGSANGSGVIFSADVAGPDHLTFLIVPKFSTSNRSTPAKTYDGYLSGGVIYSQAGGNNTSAAKTLMDSTGVPYAYYSTDVSDTSSTWANVQVNWDGTISATKNSATVTEALTAYSSFESIKPTALNTWLTGIMNAKTTLYNNAGGVLWKAGDSAPTTLPFRIYAIASGKSAATDIDISLAEEPLSLFIEPRTTATGTAAIVFAEVRLRNNTDQDITATKIDLLRKAKQTTRPDNFGTETLATDTTAATTGGRIGISDTTTAPTGTTAGTTTVSGTWKIPANSTVTVAYLNHSLMSGQTGFYNLTAKATYSGSEICSGNGGVQVKTGNDTYTINLVDTAGNPITEANHEVKPTTLAGVDVTGVTKVSDSQYTVVSANPMKIIVDGNDTGIVTNSDNLTINVTMYKLTKTITGNTPSDPTWKTTVNGAEYSFDYIASTPNGVTITVAAPDPDTFTFSWGAGSYLHDGNADTVNRVGDVLMTDDRTVVADYAGKTWTTTVITRYPTLSGSLSQSATGTNSFMIVDSTDLNTAVGTVTGTNGRYTISNLPPDKTYYIKINGQLVYDEDQATPGTEDRTPVTIADEGTTTVDMGRIEIIKDPTSASSTVTMDNGGLKSNYYYFPQHSYMGVTVAEASGEKLLTLEHDTTDITTPKAFHVTATQQTVTASFGYSGSITLYLDGRERRSNIVAADVKSVKLYPDNGSGSADTTATPVTATRGGTIPLSARYTADQALEGVYHVYVNGFPTGVTVSESAKTASVYLQSVTVNDGGETTTTASYFYGGDYKQTDQATAGEIPTGVTIDLVHGTVSGKAADGWEANGAVGTLDSANDQYTALATNSTTTSKEQVLTAKYKVGTGTATVTVNKNDAADAGHTVQISTKNTLDSSAITLADQSDGTYTDAGVSPGTYYIFVDGKLTPTAAIDGASAQTITVTGGGTTEATVDLYTVKVNTHANGSAATATVTSADKLSGANPIVVFKGATGVALNGTAATGYDVTQPTWTKVKGAGIASGGTSSPAATLDTITAETEYTLSFAELQVTVNFYKNGGTWSSSATDPQSTTGAYSAAVTAPTATVSRTGHTFKEWNTKADGTGTKVTPGTTTYGALSAAGTLDVYAIWTADKYDVTYANSATSTDPQFTATELSALASQQEMGDSVTVDTTLIAVNGQKQNSSNLYYKFTGWTTSDATISSGAFTMPAGDVTLTANWEPVYITVALDLQGNGSLPSSGDWTTGSKSIQKGDNTDLPTLANAGGYTFGGWAASAGSTTVAVVGGGNTGALTADKTYYAIWLEDPTTAIFHLNGGDKWGTTGSDTTDPVTVTGVAGANASSGKANPTRANYAFGGWATTAGGTTAVTPKFPAVGAAAADYYAIWNEIPHTITYAPGVATSATIATADQTDTVNQSATSYTVKKSDIITGTAAGWTFKEWNTAANGSGTAYAGDGSATITGNITADITLTAQWQVDVTYKYEDGVTGDTDKTLNYNTADSAMPTPTRAGYTFGGWFTGTNGTGTQYTSTKPFTAPTTLHAKWTVNQYTVDFLWNIAAGGHNVGDSVGTTTGNYGAAITTPANPSIIGYTFGGWFREAGCTTPLGSATYPDNNNMKVYAKWTEDDVTVTFHTKGGTWASGFGGSVAGTTNDYAVTGKYHTGTLTAPTSANISYAGYTFMGWSESSTGTTTVTVPTTFGSAKADYYAVWTEDPTTANFHLNSGDAWKDGTTTATISVTGVAGSAATPGSDKTPPTRANYAFGGWATTAGGTTAVTPKFPAVGAAAADYYAIWNEIPHTITYAPGVATSATIATADQTDTVNQSATSYTVKKSDIITGTAAGWTFKEWNTAANGSGTAYAGDGSATITGNITADITLTAQWQVDVTYKYEDGVTGDTDKTLNYNTADSAMPTPTRAGYTFGGWFTGTNGTGTEYTSTDPFTAPTTLHAKWTAIKYDYVFNANNGSWTGGVTTQKRNQEVDTVVAKWGTGTGEVDPARTGYTFEGWGPDATSTTADLITFDANGPKMPVNGTTVYAVWTANEYTVTYDVGKNTSGQIKSGQATQTVTYDDGTSVVRVGDLTNTTNTIIEAKPSENLTGWTFVEWNDKADGTGNTWAEGADLDGITADMTLYAQWTVDVTFDHQEPEGTASTPETKTAPAGGAVTSFPTAPSDLTHYTFDSWNTKSDGTGTTVTSTTTFDAPTTVYAKWTPKKYTVSFVDNSGDANNPAAEANKDYNSTITLPNSNGDKVGYTFAGWYKDNNAWTQSAGAAGDSYTVTQTETLYGKWDPEAVTITYTTAHGKAPTETTAYKYDEEYTVRGEDEITGVNTGDGWNAAGDIFTEGTTRWRFDGWKIAAASKTVQDGDKFDLTTANGVVVPSGTETAYTLTLEAQWTQLFTITYDTNGHGNAPAALENKPNGNYSAANYSAITGGAWDVRVFTVTGETDHYSFKTWNTKPDGTGDDVNPGGTVTINGADITLYAIWEQQYKITLKDAVRPGGTVIGDVQAKFGGTNVVASAAKPYTYVSGPFQITDLGLIGATGYDFQQWDAADDTGDFTNGTGTGKITTTKIDDTFTPTADTELTPTYVLGPSLSPNVDGYQLNFATDAQVGTDATTQAAKWQYGIKQNDVNKPTNTLPKYTWTGNDATLGDVTVTKNVAGATEQTLTLGADYTITDVGGTKVIQLQRSYLLGLEATQDYTVTVKSTTNGKDTNKTAKLWAVVTPDKLIEVVITVEDGTSADYESDPKVTPVAGSPSASATDTARDRVKYLDHKETTINPDNLLSYTWYYGPKAPTQQAYPDKAAATAAAEATSLGATKINGETGSSVPVLAAYKGQYLFAVVEATGTGYGAVITNSIPVDYDAVIAVNKDGAADTTDGAYTVYLLPQPTSGSNDNTYTQAALLAKTPVAASHTASTNLYATDPSALTGGVTYDIYVNRLEGDDSIFVKTGKTVNTQINADATSKPTLDFYSVNAVTTDLLHKQDSNSKYVGESFGTANADAPTVEFYAEDIATKFSSGKGVFTGTKVTAKASKGWSQDYDANWGVKEDAGATAPTLPYLTDNQPAGGDNGAVSKGKDFTNIDAKTWIGIQLEQNVYTVTGNIWVNKATSTPNAGIVNTGNDVPTLTYENTTDGNTYTFKAATVSNVGRHTGVVTFTGVPRSGVTGAAIAGQYVVEATAKDTNTKSTIKKYIPGQDLTGKDDATINGVTALTDRTLAADVTAGGVTGPMFTVVVEGSVYALQAADQEAAATQKTASHTLAGTPTATAPAAPSTAPRLAVQPWTGTYANITAKTYTIDVTNEGNMPLDVTLNIRRTLDGTDVIVYGPSAAGTDDLTQSGTTWTDSDNKVTFGDLKETFTLAAKGDAGDKVTFTVTVPADLTVNTAADYAFELTSKEGALYGPSVTYKLTQEVTPLEVTGISTSHDTGTDTYTPANLEISGSTSIPSGVKVNTATDPDVVYEWYAVPHGSTVALNNDGKLTVGGTVQTPIVADGSVGVPVGGGSYKPNTAHAGMDVYLVARGQGVSGNVLKAALTDPPHIVVKYDLDIQVNENNDPTKNEGNYKVYLWPDKNADGTNNTDTFATTSPKAIEAVSGTNTADGLYKAAGLTPGVTYKIYTNAVGGTTNANWSDSGVTADYSDYNATSKPTVVYHDVILSNTLVSNQQYDPAITADTSKFLATYTGVAPYNTARTDTLKAPTAKVGTTDVATSTTSADRWVQSGTTIALAYPAWTKDYTLTWTGVDATSTNAKDTGSASTKQVTASTTIGTQLELNLYDFQLWVEGKGTITEGKLTSTDGGLSFTSKADGTGIWNGTNGTKGSISENNAYTFEVPAGAYDASAEVADGVTLLGYRKPHGSSDTPAGTNIAVTVNTDSSAAVVLSATGRAMTVADDADTAITGATAASGTARYTTSATDATVNQTITLPYGYDDKELTLTVKNTGNEVTDVIYQVEMDDSGKHSSSLITVTAPTAPAIVLDGTANMDKDDTTTVKVGIAAGLAASDTGYASTLVFSYNADDGDTTKSAKVTYNLTIKVEPTEFTAVTVVDEDGATVSSVALDKALKFDTYTTSTVDDWTNGKHLTASEYTYQWYHGPADKTATETWDKTTGNVTVTDATAISGATGATLAASEIKKYPGEHIYLVISAVKDTNVIEAAISAPVTTGFQPVVKIAVDGVDQSTVAGFDGTGYTVTISNADNSKTWQTEWDDTAKGFVPVESGAQVSLDASGEYTAKVSRIKDDSANLIALTDKLKNTTANQTVTAPYFTVNTVETKAFEGITGLGEDFDGADKRTGPAVSLALADGTTLNTGTPVLKNQDVVAKTAAWTQDYELTWYTRMDGAATVPVRDDAYEGTPTMTAKGSKVNSATASGTGITETVTNKLYVGGRLDQIKYTVVGTVAGTGTVSAVALAMTDPKTASYIYPDPSGTSPVAPSDTSSDATNKTLAAGETVTFTVVKGTFTITPTEGAGTVIKKVSWEGTDEAAGITVIKDKQVELKADPANRRYDFVVTVEGADIKLKVSDDVTTPNTAESNPDEWKDAANGVERYFNYIHFDKTNSATPATKDYVLTLTNGGNKPIKVNAEVYRFDAAPATGFGLDAAKWAATKATGTLVYETADGATADLKSTDNTRTVLSLADMMDADTVVAAKSAAGVDGSAAAGKITLGADAWSKDSGAYVFHFMGVTDDTDEVAVDVYYVLDLTVDQLPIKAVQTQMKASDGTALADGSMPGVGDKLQVKGYVDGATDKEGLDNVTVQRSTTSSDEGDAKSANLTDADVKLAWVKVTKGATVAVGDFTVAADGTLSTTKGYTISEGKEYTLTAADKDHDFYLVAYAPNTATNQVNAKDKAIAGVIRAKRTAGVKVTLNGYPVTGTSDPGYEIYLVESGETFDKTNAATGADGTWATTWNATTNRYEAAIDVDNKTYQVYAVTYKGGSTIIKAIDGTLGKQTPSGTKDEETVPYWDVNFTENLAVNNTQSGFKSYLPGGAANTDNAIQKALSVTVSTEKGGTTYESAALTAAKTPVLAGMNVKVSVDGTKDNNATTPESWEDKSDYHTLTTVGWSSGGANSGIGYAATIASGDIAVTAERTFSATLAQKLFTVKFTVQDVTDGGPSADTKVQTVTLTPRGADAGATYKPSVTGTYAHGDVVTINNVPAGDFTVQATKYPGSSTLVKGYTWNDADTVDKEGDIVTVTATTANNEDTTGNTIQMVKATKVVNWYDNFNTDDGSALADVVPSNGFEKTDKAGGPYLALTEGYEAPPTGTAVLQYTVRVENGGNEAMTNFFLTVGSSELEDLGNVLKDVKYFDKDGTLKDEHKDATQPFTLGEQEYLEFTVTIPAGQPGRKALYQSEIVPHCDLLTGVEAPDLVTNQSYKPEYQVKSDVSVEGGSAAIFYGDDAFDGAVTQLAVSNGFTGQDFNYAILTEAELTAYLDGAARPDNVYTTDGVTGGGATTHKKPDWLVLNGDTGVFTVTGDPATGVHVKKTEDEDGELVDVPDELVVYVKVTSDDDELLEKIVPFTVNVKTSPLKIVTANTADAAQKALDGAAYRTLYSALTTATYPGQGEDIAHGAKVLLEYFNYTQVENQNNTADVLDANGHPAYAAGANRWNSADGADNSSYGVVTKGHWSVAPAAFDGTGDNAYVAPPAAPATNDHDYTFTYYYDGTDATDKYDYEDAKIILTIPALVPELSLKFADAIDVDTAGKVVKGTTYTTADGTDKTGLNGDVPVKLDYTAATKRLGEQITYLDDEPQYTVKLQMLGELERIDLTVSKDGFALPDGFPTSLSSTDLTDGVYSFEVTVDHMNSDAKLWAGEHKLTVTAKGYRAGEEEPAVTASYELTLNILKKTIAKADVGDLTDPLPGNKPDTDVTVKAWDPKGDDIKPNEPDKKGNTPVETEVEWTDSTGNEVPSDKPFEDGEDYTFTATLTPDPNYVFAEEEKPSEPAQPDEKPNYTLNDKGDKDWPDEDPDLEAEKNSSGEVVLTKPFELPTIAVLMFDDVNQADSTDVTGPAVDDERVITLQIGEGLGKYTINLGAYDNTVADIKVTETANTLPADAVWTLTPTDIASLAKDAKQSYDLDLSGVDTTALSAGATLVLKAVGKDAYGEDVTATYTLKIEVKPELKFNDTDPNDAADGLDAHEWSGDYENARVVVYYLDQIPDFYDVYLQNPGGKDLYDVAMNVTGNTGARVDGKTGNDRIGILSADASTQFDPSASSNPFDTLDKLAKASAPGAADNQAHAFKADLRSLKYAGEYTLKVHAKGTSTQPAQASLMANDTVEADYTLIVKVVPRPIVVANVTGLGAAEVDQKVSDNISKIEVHGQVLYRGDESIDGSNLDNVSAKDDVDLINKVGDTEHGPEKGLDVNGLTRLGYKITWVELDENGNEKGELSADPETGDTFKANTAYRVKLKLIPDPNYIFVRASTEEHDYGTEEDFFYFDPKDNGKNTGVSEDNPRIDEEQVDYTLETTTGVKVDLHPEEDDTEPNKPIVIEKEQEGKIAQLKFDDVKLDDKGAATNDTTGPKVDDVRTISVTKGSKLGVYKINLGAYVGNVDQVAVVDQEPDLNVSGRLAQRTTTTDKETGETVYTNNWTLKRLDEPHDTLLEVDADGNPVNKNTWELDLSGLNTSEAGSGVFVLVLTAQGIRAVDKAGLETEVVKASYTITVNITNPGGGGGGGGGDPACPNQVTYLLGLYGTTNDPVMEKVADKGKVKTVPNVTAIDGYKFLGWSLTGPTGDAQADAKRELVDPKSVTISGDTTFYAVYQPVYELGRPFHEHYVIGYPNGEFGPADNINRASVATIIARAVLPNFVEGADYGNPGGYSDVSGHWAESAIAYCSKYGVFKGYDDGTFQPNQSITRQELALVVARLNGVQSAKEMPFADVGDAAAWAMDGIYTAYANGWVNGYTDGTFRPLNPISRAETVKIFNAYLYRGVDAEGLSKLTEYVHSGVASNVTENGTTEYMTWPDVPKDYWAYYEIIEAANDHEYAVDETVPKGYTLPETWDKCWIDEKWRYHDDLNDGGPTVGLLSAGFRAWNR